ncbi:MAG TPA: nuclear transport factor 2 family protein [Mycobacteriales bacterium]|nr:nuclear transport factor 2 family protein [Mycobacteriales bacterium]
MTDDAVQQWLDSYVAAWRSYEPAAIGALFSADATYAYRPWDTGDEVVRGRDAIVASWLDQPDQERSWVAEYHPLLVSGDRAVARGVTRYGDGTVFDNLWELRFDGEGRCTGFVEWYMERPRPAA